MKIKLVNIFVCILLYLLSGMLLNAQDAAQSIHLDDTTYLEHEPETLPTQKDSIVDRTFKADFKQKYTDKSFDYVEPKHKKSAFEKFLEWLFNNPSKSESKGSFSAFWAWLIYGIIGIALIYTIYILVSVLLGKKGAWLIFKKSDDKGVFYGDDEEAILETDYNALINSAIASGDFRLAVRYHYLLVLQKLAAKGIITLHQDKTNSDYRYEIKDKKLNQSFGYISYIYDYTWYGAFDMGRFEYEMASGAFDETTNMI